MKKMSKKIIRIICMMTAAIILTTSLGEMAVKPIVAEAVIDENLAVLYRDFKSKISDQTSLVFIGTYIVHKDALTDEIYERAKASKSDSGQDVYYYKSELSGEPNVAQWYDVNNIDNGVLGISLQGTPVDESILDPLYVTYYAGDDGILRYAKSMTPVNVFDIPDPYDLSKLPELQAVWMMYTKSESAESITQEDFLKNRNSNTTGNIRSDVYLYQFLSTFFSLDLQDDKTRELDQQLVRLNSLYIDLKAAGDKEEQAAAVYDLMAQIDAQRRMLVYERLSEADTNVLNVLYTLCSGSYYTPYGNFKDSSSETGTSDNPDYITELQDSAQHDFTASNSIASALIRQWLVRLGLLNNSEDWWTALDNYVQSEKERKKKENSENEDYVADASQSSEAFAVDNDILTAIGNAMSECGKSYTTYSSKSLTDNTSVLGHARYDYSNGVIENLAAGPVDYLTYVINISAGKPKDKPGEFALLSDYLLGLGNDAYYNALMSGPSDEYLSLSDENSKKAALDTQFTELETKRDELQFLIKSTNDRNVDPEVALADVQSRLTTAEQKLKSIPTSAFATDATRSLEAHIVWLKGEAERITEENKSLLSVGDKLAARKAELQTKRDGCLDTNDLAGAKKYDAMIAAVDQDIAAAGGSGSGSMADKLIDKAMDKLADNANADLSGTAQALAAMGETDKLEALKEKAIKSGAGANTLSGIQDAINSTKSEGMSEDELLSLLENLFGKSIDEMSDSELAIATASSSRVARMGLTPAEKLTATLLGRLVSTGNKYIYSQYSGDSVNNYVSLFTISNATPFRYYYDETNSMATMTKGTKQIYIFERGSNLMYKGSVMAKPEEMGKNAVFSKEMYISEADADSYFECTSEYVYDSQKAICLTATMLESVKDFSTQLADAIKAASE
ncbi:MAG: hypothetical protein K6G12_02475 [Lachnospiraceae bacterium]|nr:hypothetical protein [Lachnospiraceae bacterium]